MSHGLLAAFLILVLVSYSEIFPGCRTQSGPLILFLNPFPGLQQIPAGRALAVVLVPRSQMKDPAC